MHNPGFSKKVSSLTLARHFESMRAIQSVKAILIKGGKACPTFM